ncbi:MAG TPA: hypothetical protein VMJ35_07865 [Dongiaceae bacterium]|nr:hypothetical protein [Dongiaceae bacterium]
MKTRSIVMVAGLCALMCGVVGWRIGAAQIKDQGQNSMVPQVMVASDPDLQLLRHDLRAQKQKIIAENLPMTEQEAIKLWAIYKRYTEELRQINDEKFRLVKEYGDQWGTMTNDEALIYIRRWLEVDQQVQTLRLKYVPEVSQALPGKKAATFFQLDRRISMMMDIQLSSQLPLAAGKGNEREARACKGFEVEGRCRENRTKCKVPDSLSKAFQL